MESQQYLIDTNILIYATANQLPKSEIERISQIFVSSFNISVITRIEFLGWKRHTPQGFKVAKEFVQNAYIYQLDPETVEKTIELKKQYSIRAPDAIIAATAILNDLVLVTRNEVDFKDLSLKIYNPFSE